MNPSKKDLLQGRAPLPAAFLETVYMLATCACAFVIGAFIALGWAV